MIGQTISHYQILEKLGEGGMGVVYKARDTKLDRFVALKFLPHHLTAGSDDRERFAIEARAAAALNHPNIATIHAVEESGGETFIVMEYIEGTELKSRLRSGPVSINQVIAISRQIAEGLRAAHDKEIVHRDIKSANIMITAGDHVKIMDFGLAKIRGGSQVTKAGSTVGTASYMSPEQARGGEVDRRSDLWSFGVVMYELLTGQLPFASDYEQAVVYSILNETPKSVASLRKDVPPAVARIVERAMTKDPESRYQSAEEILDDLGFRASAAAGPATILGRIRRPGVWVPAAVVIVAVLAALAWWMNHSAGVRWAREEAIPEIERLTQDGLAGEGGSAWNALDLAAEAEQYIPDDPLFMRLVPQFSRPLRLTSDPPGARVYAKPYSRPSEEWRYIGQTPLDSIRFPLGFSRVKLETAGYRTAYDLLWNSRWFSDTLRYELPDEGTVPEGMELAPAAASWYEGDAAPGSLHMPGLEGLEPVAVASFLMDRHEVTNGDYKKFIDGGGYRDRKFWKHPIVRDGKTLAWEDAVKLFVDRTGQPGPATWEVGDYPPGKGDFPVAGVSWYEAQAYAAFAGKSLPTIYHWDRAAFPWASNVIVPMSNIGGDGPVPVGSSKGENRFGITDLGGNVREWCVNETNDGRRFILGGGWNDPAYSFNDAYAQQPIDRTETNGFRCIRYANDDSARAEIIGPVTLPFRDFLSEPKVSNEVFSSYLSQYTYDRTALDAVVERSGEAEDYTWELVSFNAAYGGERMTAYLYLPKKGTPPYQTVVYFPGSGAIHSRSSEDLSPGLGTIVLKSGRAFMHPIYKSTYERGDALNSDYPDETNFWKDHVIMWAKDCSRSIDYLESRPEIDAANIAYFGVSWGGFMGGIIPAVETRIKATILLVAGLLHQRALPEADPVNFLPRFRSPVLMLNGKYDFFFPYETSQLPFFTLLGTPDDRKKIISYEGGHSVPRTQIARESLAWLDRYLGPLK